MAQTLDFVIDGGILLNIGVRVGDIGFGLVVIVVGNEIFHRIIGEKLPKFGAKLGGKGLVVGEHKGRAVELGDNIRHGEGLARTCHTQQNLFLHALF